MRSLAAIRTNKWTEEEDRLLARLRAAFGAEVAVVFHNRPASVVPPCPVIDINDDWVAQNGFAHVPDWGWRCGDYSYYALRQARPDHDFYWLVEPDVHFTSDPETFFAAFAADQRDAMGYALGPFRADIRFTRGLPGVAHHRAIFAMTRFSGRALDRLAELRRAAAKGDISQRDYPNDEIFTFSHVAADADLTFGQLELVCPDWFDGAQFTTDPDLLFDILQASAVPGRVYHPVRGRQAFVTALARRMASNASIAVRMRWSIRALSDDEVETVAAAAAEIVRTRLRDLRVRRPARAMAARRRKA